MLGEEPETDADEQLKRYSLAFLKSVPVMIGVVGLPYTGVRQAGFQESSDGYKYSCGAAIQNMLLAATALELGSLCFTLFDQKLMREFLGVDEDQHLVALVCIGYPAAEPPSPGRLPLSTKMRKIN
jgi:nitroreductase